MNPVLLVKNRVLDEKVDWNSPILNFSTNSNTNVIIPSLQSSNSTKRTVCTVQRNKYHTNRRKIDRYEYVLRIQLEIEWLACAELTNLRSNKHRPFTLPGLLDCRVRQ